MVPIPVQTMNKGPAGDPEQRVAAARDIRYISRIGPLESGG